MYIHIAKRTMQSLYTHKATVLCDVIMFPFVQVILKCFYMNMHLPIVLCCGMQQNYIVLWVSIPIPSRCVSVFLFLSYMNMPVPIVLVVNTKGCLQTNYGDVVKFIVVPSFTCVHF